MKELSIRLKERSRSTAAVDSGGDNPAERKEPDGVERFVEDKRVKFDLRDLRERDGRKVPGMHLRRGMSVAYTVEL